MANLAIGWTYQLKSRKKSSEKVTNLAKDANLQKSQCERDASKYGKNTSWVTRNSLMKNFPCAVSPDLTDNPQPHSQGSCAPWAQVGENSRNEVGLPLDL